MIPPYIFELIVSNSREAVLIAAPDNNLFYANPAARELFAIDDDSPQLPEFISRLLAHDECCSLKYRKPFDERMLWLNCHHQKIDIDGKVFTLFNCRDITFEKQRERRLEKEARTDFLSGLSNRREFQNVLDANCERPICVAVVDVDHFKQINDRHGHLIGDAAIRFVAEQMLKSFFEAICVARLGGEEFGVIADASIEDVAAQFEEFRRTIQRSSFSEHNIGLTVSVGLAIGLDSNDGHALLECADKAVYESKNLGRNRLTVFELRGV